jgi:hypothetical protein
VTRYQIRATVVHDSCTEDLVAELDDIAGQEHDGEVRGEGAWTVTWSWPVRGDRDAALARMGPYLHDYEGAKLDTFTWEVVR